MSSLGKSLLQGAIEALTYARNDVENCNARTYQHYKTAKLYQVIGFALHSETYEEMVIYKALYNCEKFGNNQLWIRPKKMFFENIEYNGQITPRFKLTKHTDKPEI
jgi:hypothetical protein